MIDLLNCPSCHYSYHHNDSFAYASVDEKRERERGILVLDCHRHSLLMWWWSHCCCSSRKISCYVLEYENVYVQFRIWVVRVCTEFSILHNFSDDVCSVSALWCGWVRRNTIFSVEIQIWALINAMMNKIEVRRQMRVERRPTCVRDFAQWTVLFSFFFFFFYRHIAIFPTSPLLFDVISHTRLLHAVAKLLNRQYIKLRAMKDDVERAEKLHNHHHHHLFSFKHHILIA